MIHRLIHWPWFGFVCLLGAGCGNASDAFSGDVSKASGAAGIGSGGTSGSASAGSSTSGGSSGPSNVGTGGTGASATAGGTSSGAGGSLASAGSGGAANGGAGATADGGSSNVTPGRTKDLVAATHNDGWIEGFDSGATTIGTPIVIGAWFHYQYPMAPSCNAKHDVQGGQKVCFSGGNCSSATAALGFNLCAVANLDTSKWPAMQTFITSHALSTAANSQFSFGACNTGAKIASLNWEGTLPSGVSLAFHDAADKVIGSALPLTAGATSLTIPATVDGGQVASIHFLVDGTSAANWDFCLTQLTISYQ